MVRSGFGSVRAPPTEPSTGSLSSTFLTFTPSTKPPCVLRQGSLTLSALLRAHYSLHFLQPERGRHSVCCLTCCPASVAEFSQLPTHHQPASQPSHRRSQISPTSLETGPKQFPIRQPPVASRRTNTLKPPSLPPCLPAVACPTLDARPHRDIAFPSSIHS